MNPITLETSRGFHLSIKKKNSIQSFPKSFGDLDKLPLASLVPSAFMFYNRGSGGSSALMASGSYVRQSNQRIAAV